MVDSNGNMAIIPAAGVGKRLRSVIGEPKQFTTLAGKPLLAHTLEVFERCAEIGGIIVVTRKADIERVQKEVIAPFGLTKVQEVITGGKTRQESVWAGLQALQEAMPAIVAVHDAARIFVTEEIIRHSIEAARIHGGGVTGIPAVDTVKKCRGETVEATIDRSVLWYAQTPQTFQYTLLMRAFREAAKRNFVGTDEAMLFEETNKDIVMVRGSKLNFKITDPDDLELARALIQMREDKTR